MDYLHSPSKLHTTTLQSPTTLFDSPSLSDQRFSDHYAALSGESPPANFDDLRTPLPPQRHTLDWTVDTHRKRPALYQHSNTNSNDKVIGKVTGRPQVDPSTDDILPSATVTVLSPIRKSGHLHHNPSFVSPQRLQCENTLYEKESPISILRESSASPFKSPLDTLRQNTNLVARSETERKYYYSSPIKFTAGNTVGSTVGSSLNEPKRDTVYSGSPVKHNSTAFHSPVKHSSKEEDKTIYSPMKRMESIPQSVVASSPTAVSSITGTTTPAAASASPSAAPGTTSTTTPTTYRSPVYSNSSYKPSDKLVDSIHQQQASPGLARNHDSLRETDNQPLEQVLLSPSPPRSSVTDGISSSTDKGRDYHRETSSARIYHDNNGLYPSQQQQPDDIPHYMRTTASYQSRLQTQVEHHAKLHKTKSGGITKRGRSSKIPQFRSTTRINAIDDIRNEMKPEDVYIPLAARVKLFEKELGNGVKPAVTQSHQHEHRRSNNAPLSNSTSNSNSTPRLTKPRSPHLLTRERSSNSTHYCYQPDDQQSTSSSTKSHRRSQHIVDSQEEENKTTQNRSSQESSSTKRSYSSMTRDDAEGNVKLREEKRLKRGSSHIKPFHFATDDRAARYQETFRAKLSLWKEKENRDQRRK